MRETLLSRTLRTLFAGGTAGLALLSLPAAAQSTQTTATPTGTSIPRVEITGTNIRRAEAETAAPVLTLNRADIERAGRTTVAEVLQTLAVDNQGSVPMTFGTGFAAGASGISLRGLGVGSTLVLLNGRRVAPYGLADDGQKVFVDLNIIPSEAIERVEILKGGASAIYGSDAIAGVVNIILRRDYRGTAVRGSYGQSEEGDGNDYLAAISHGFGDLQTDRFNVLMSLEVGRRDAMFYNKRDREHIGRADLRPWGYSAQQALGGTGAIVTNNAAGSSIVGNVRDPATNNYYSRGNPAGPGFTRFFPGAACANFTTHPQGDPGGGCLIDAPYQYNQIQPEQKRANFFARGTMQLNPGTQAYAEFNYYRSESDSQTTPSGIHGSVGYPGGPVSNAAVALGPAHPDNPYFGTTARLRYLATDVGPRTSRIESDFVRALAGVKGSFGGWDYDAALLYSQNKLDREQNGYLQRDVTFALLNPSPANVAAASANPLYAALPPGTVWRIAESAGLNSPAVYAALSPTITNNAKTRLAQADIKISREFGQLAGGPWGVAAGLEFRHESTELEPTTGTERGNIIGLGYSAYDGTRNVTALYGEVLAPVHPTVELSAALRADHYNDVGDSFTPTFGFKWTPMRTFALRGTVARGFRAPSAAESGTGGLAAFSTAADPVRCALGVSSACEPSSVAVITSPNPGLSPEKSRSMNLGIVWDPYPKTSILLDVWEIERRNEINQEQITTAIASGRVARDPTTATAIPGDPGQITAVLASYVNSAEAEVRGLDLEFRQRFDIGRIPGEFHIDTKWTHLFRWLRTEQDGTTRDFAGTHGNCDVTNCIGTPDDRVNFRLGWDNGPFRVSANVNFRGDIKNTLFKNDPAGCAMHFDDGRNAPNARCEIPSFTTVDLSFRWKAGRQWEVFGSIQNITDEIAPLDPLTYGAQSYNPLDYQGAVGRFFTAGVRYAF